MVCQRDLYDALGTSAAHETPTFCFSVGYAVRTTCEDLLRSDGMAVLHRPPGGALRKWTQGPAPPRVARSGDEGPWAGQRVTKFVTGVTLVVLGGRSAHSRGRNRTKTFAGEQFSGWSPATDDPRQGNMPGKPIARWTGLLQATHQRRRERRGRNPALRAISLPGVVRQGYAGRSVVVRVTGVTEQMDP